MVDQNLINKLVSNVKQARRLIREHESEIGIPEIERSLRIADMNLHWILWLLGEAVQYAPDIPLED